MHGSNDYFLNMTKTNPQLLSSHLRRTNSWKANWIILNLICYGLLFLLQYTGDLSFAIGAVSILMNECQDVIIENMTVNTNQPNNVTKPTMPPALEEVFQLLCPNDCTFNGKCVNGSCVCKKDYTAADCSISIYQRPTIARCVCNKIPRISCFQRR